MYDLLDYAHCGFPKLPFLCVRVLDGQIQRISRKAIEIAARTLGAAAYVDFPDLVAQRGAQAAEQELRRAVLAALTGRRAGNGQR
jgi:hypothetical protein